MDSKGGHSEEKTGACEGSEVEQLHFPFATTVYATQWLHFCDCHSSSPL